MPTHQLTIELSTGAHRILQRLISSGDSQSESAVVEDALFELEFALAEGTGSENLAAWQEEEIKAAIEEDLAHPELAISADQLDQYLRREQSSDLELAEAS